MPNRIKVLYVQVLPGGGSLIALYEMLRSLDTSIIEPLVLLYYKNQYTVKLETLINIRVIYLYNNREHAEAEIVAAKKYKKFTGYILSQITAFKKYYCNNKALRNRLYTFIKNEAPDIIHHNNDVHIDRDIIRAASKAGVLQIIHTRSLTSYRHKLSDYIINFFLIRKASYRIYITEAVRKYYDKLFYLGTQKSLVLHDIIDTANFKPGIADVELKKSFGIHESQFVITSIGRITGWKGQDILMEAVNLLKNKSVNLKVLIVGPYDNGLGSKKYYEHLQTLAADYGLQKNVLFTGNREDIPAIINISDIVVHTALKPEPQGLVIIEALLCKKYVIASDSGGAAEIIKKYGGQLAKSGDAHQLAELLLKFINHRGIREQYPINYERLLTDFDGRKQIKKIINIYEKVLGISIQ